MTALSPRDALREVRESLASTTGAGLEEALATLSALVERAGEPVANPLPFTFHVSDAMPKDSILLLGSAAWEAMNRGEAPHADSYAFVRLATTPAAPGASHE